MVTQGAVEEIKLIITPIIEEGHLELVDLVLVKSRFRPTLRILVDRKEGGITVGECAVLNRRIGDVLDAQNIFSAGYVLEVFSPGADRPISTPNDFARCMNRRVRFFLKSPINGKVEWMGSVVKVELDSVTIDLSGTMQAIPLSLIQKARQEF